MNTTTDSEIEQRHVKFRSLRLFHLGVPRDARRSLRILSQSLRASSMTLYSIQLLVLIPWEVCTLVIEFVHDPCVVFCSQRIFVKEQAS